jgi:hypothetical protein
MCAVSYPKASGWFDCYSPFNNIVTEYSDVHKLRYGIAHRHRIKDKKERERNEGRKK